MKAIARTIRITPKKASLIAGMVRGKTAKESLDILRFTPKKAAKILFKLLKSAVENAKNNFKQDETALFIKEILVLKGPTLKRSVPVSRGRTHPILKRTAHITILLGIKEEVAKKGKKAEKNTVGKNENAQTEKVIKKNAEGSKVKKVKAAKKTSEDKEESNTKSAKKESSN